MLAASLATSVPVFPIAIPISACFNAGASLTPSPVEATTSPFAWQFLTIRYFCSGATRAKMTSPFKALRNSSLLIVSSSVPEITRALSEVKPI